MVAVNEHLAKIIAFVTLFTFSSCTPMGYFQPIITWDMRFGLAHCAREVKVGL